jgi:hypothetical protein
MALYVHNYDEIPYDFAGEKCLIVNKKLFE